MAYQIVWSPKALEDAESIAAYISRDSVAYAAAVVQKILEVTRKLSKFPFSGRIVPEFGEETIREKFAYNYRINYRIRGEIITIASVIHGKKILEQLEANECLKGKQIYALSFSRDESLLRKSSIVAGSTQSIDSCDRRRFSSSTIA